MTHRTVAGLLALASIVCAQRRVDPKMTYQRVICVVPLIGQGTADDPKRPMYAPWPMTPSPSRTGIIGYAHQVSDDGKYALVEFVATDSSAFTTLLADKSIKVFIKGKDKKEDIENALKQYKKDFDIERFGLVMP